MAVSGSDAAGDAVRSRIAGEMLWRRTKPRERFDDVVRIPRQGERPTDRAQWDEVHGCWVEWDDDQRLWVHIDHPAARSSTADAGG